jgi:hypothetical protein
MRHGCAQGQRAGFLVKYTVDMDRIAGGLSGSLGCSRVDRVTARAGPTAT